MSSASRSRNKLGLKGVSKRDDTGKYRAVISTGRKNLSLGEFDAPDEAAEAYKAAALLKYGKYAKK